MNTNRDKQPQRISLPLLRKGGESRQQRNERVATEILTALKLQEADRQCVANLRAAGFSEAEIEEFSNNF